jgi:dienelactone hydrolase
MARIGRSVQAATALLCAVLVAAACGEGDSGGNGFEVTSDTVSHPTTQDILVFAPDAEGSWPVVVVMHGVGGRAADMAEFATHLAREGLVVFVPNYRTDVRTEEGVNDAGRDGECAYRFARTIASDYGGDLDQPVTFVGWSLGASYVLAAGLTDDIDPSGEGLSCFEKVPRPDVVVAMSGCHYEYEGRPTGFDLHGSGNMDADVELLAGEEDTTCAAWQTEDAAAELRSAGYDVDLLILDGASHYAPIFHDRINGEDVVVTDDPEGERTVEVILEAIAANQDGG